MPASRRHLEHLSRLLSNGNPEQRPPLPEPQLSDLFDSIASNQVRISKTAWQGHRVDALLWHLPDLKPAGQAALSAYIAHCWRAHMQKETDLPQPKTAQETPTYRLPAVNRVMNMPKTKVDAGGKSFTATGPGRDLTNKPAPRRDWFDGLTDWVAAVVSLFK